MDGKLISGKGNLPRFTAAFQVAIAAGLAMCFGAPVVSRADRIDEALIHHAREITDYLIKKKCKNVGVLPFRMQTGNKLPEFRGGMIVDNMCDRVQLALVYAANPEAPPIGIVDHAAAVAAKKLQGASYRTPADRKKLFTVQYPLMWGDPPAQVVPDTFLAGKVSVSADYRTTTVTIEAFDRANPGTRLTPVTQFSVRSDRYILADLGQGYSVAKTKLAALKRGLSAARDIIEDSDPPSSGSAETPGSKPEPKVEDGNSPAAEGPATSTETAPGEGQVVSLGGAPNDPFPVAWTVYYDGVAQSPSTDANAPGERNFVIPDPKPGQKVTFGVKNTGDSVVGLVLTVNGVSTLYEERGEADQMQPWILEPGKEFLVKGYHQKDGRTYVPIVGFADEDTQAILADLTDERAAGLIEMFIVKAGSPDTSHVALARSMRRPSPQILAAGPAKSIADLQRGLAQSANLRAKRGLMAWSESQEKEDLQLTEFQSGPPVEHLVIRYYTVQK
jgi:hypothetical protein